MLPFIFIVSQTSLLRLESSVIQISLLSSLRPYFILYLCLKSSLRLRLRHVFSDVISYLTPLPSPFPGAQIHLVSGTPVCAEERERRSMREFLRQTPSKLFPTANILPSLSAKPSITSTSISYGNTSFNLTEQIPVIALMLVLLIFFTKVKIKLPPKRMANIRCQIFIVLVARSKNCKQRYLSPGISKQGINQR